MSQLRLYVDEDAEEHAVVRGLRARGVDVLTTSDADRLGSTDADQLSYAIELQRSLYTFNVRDFAWLHRQHLERGSHHFGIIVIPDQRYSIGEKVRCLAGFIARTSAEEMLDRMEYL
jgi:hypothetical protein